MKLLLCSGCTFSQGHFLFLDHLVSADAMAAAAAAAAVVVIVAVVVIDAMSPSPTTCTLKLAPLGQSRASSSTSSTYGFWYRAIWGYGGMWVCGELLDWCRVNSLSFVFLTLFFASFPFVLSPPSLGAWELCRVRREAGGGGRASRRTCIPSKICGGDKKEDLESLPWRVGLG